MTTLSEYYADDDVRMARVVRTDEHTFRVDFFLNGNKASHTYYETLEKAEEYAEDYVM